MKVTVPQVVVVQLSRGVRKRLLLLLLAILLMTSRGHRHSFVMLLMKRCVVVGLADARVGEKAAVVVGTFLEDTDEDEHHAEAVSLLPLRLLLLPLPQLHLLARLLSPVLMAVVLEYYIKAPPAFVEKVVEIAAAVVEGTADQRHHHHHQKIVEAGVVVAASSLSAEE